MQGSTSHTQPLDLRAAAHSKSKRLTKSRTHFAALTEQPRVSTPHLASMNTSPDKQEPFHGFGGICSNQDQSVAAGCAGMGHSAPCTDSALTARAQLNPGTQTPTPKPHGLSQNSLDCSGSPHGFFPYPKTLLAMCRHGSHRLVLAAGWCRECHGSHQAELGWATLRPQHPPRDLLRTSQLSSSWQ